MCIVPKLENSKAFTFGLAKFNEDYPGFLEELKLDPNKEALIEINGTLIPFTHFEIEARKQEIIEGSREAVLTKPEEAKLILEQELSLLNT